MNEFSLPTTWMTVFRPLMRVSSTYAVFLAALLLRAAVPVTIYQESGGVVSQEPAQYVGTSYGSVYWWRFGSAASEFRASAVLRWQIAPPLNFRSIKQPHGTTTQTVVDEPAGLSSATRDDTYFYYIYANKLYRKPINAAASDSAIEIPPTGFEPANFTLDTVAFWQGLLYYTFDAKLSSGVQQFALWTYNPTNQQRQFRFVANGPPIRRMLFFTYHPSTALGRAGATSDGLFLLGSDGSLMRHDMGSSSQVTTLNTAIVDFALQNRASLLPIAYSTTLYAVKQVPTSGGPFGGTLNALFALDPSSGVGGQQALDSSVPLSNQPQVTGVAADSRYVFAAVQTGATESLEAYDSQAAKPAWYFIANSLPGPVTSIVSDGTWLYFNDGVLVQKMATDAPPLDLDVQALGLEAVQTIQSLHNDLPLVANKTTFVRLYANLATNTTGRSAWFPTAALHGSLNGVEFSDSPIYPTIIPPLTLNANLGSLRTNLANTYLFEVPPSWVQPGQLSFAAMIDPAHTLPESGPLLNNSAASSVTVLPGRVPTLVFVPLANSLPNYDPNSDPNFGNIIARGKSQLPVSDFKIYFNSGTVYKKAFHIRTGRQVCVPLAGCAPSPLPLPGIDDDLFNVSNDQDEFVLWTAYYSTFQPQPAGASDVHWIGTFSEGVPSFNGIGGLGGMTLADLVSGLPGPVHDLVNLTMPADLTAVIAMRSGYTSDPKQNPWSSFQGGQSLAHELGHNYGRKHINQTVPLRFTSCGNQVPVGPYDVYPYTDPCSLGLTDYNDPAAYFGFDSMNWAPVPPDQAGDLMSYANSRWTSDFNWNALLHAIPTTTGAALQDTPPPQIDVAGQTLTLVSGHLSWNTQTAQLLPAYTLPGNSYDTNKAVQSLQALTQIQTNYPVSVRLLDQAGVLITNYPLFLLAGADGSAGEFNFAELVPFISGTRRLQIVQLGTVIAERVVSPSAPVLAVGTPVVADQSVALDWTASDADGDFLTYAIQYSADDGHTWLTLDPLYDGLSITIDGRRLPGGDSARLRVIASDGVNSTAAMTPPFALPKHAPDLVINGVLENQRLPFGGVNILHAMAIDVEDGSLPSSKLNWSFAGPASPVVTNGDAVSLVGLPPGSYAVTVQATDSDGQTGNATRHFEIGPVVVSEAAVPQLDGLASDPGYAQAATVRLSLGNRQFARASLLHASGALYVSFSDLPYGSNGVAAAQVGLRVNTTGKPGNTPQSADVGFFVNENGVPTQLAGNGTAMTTTLSTPGGFNAVVFQGDNSWSAEFSIADSLIGGWDHAAALMVSLQTSRGANWPSGADGNTPATWAAASFGAVPSPTNQPPVAIAGASRIYNLKDTQVIMLDGSASYDPEGAPLTYMWTQTSGPSLTLSNHTSAIASFTVSPDLAPASLGFQLVVNDRQTNSAPAQTTVTLRAVVAQVSAASTNAPADNIVATPGGSVSGSLTVPGLAGDTFVIQASTDFTNWTAIATNTLDYFQKIVFLDPDAAKYSERFYRAASSPQIRGTQAGSALEFNGTNSSVQVAATPDLNALPLTVTFWLNTRDIGADARGLVSKYDDSSFNGYALFLSNGHVRGWYFKDRANYIWDGGLGLDSGVVADGRWHHIALVVDTSSGRLYLDGSIVSTLNWHGTAGAPSSGTPLQFGHYAAYPVALEGTMDEITLWNRALNQGEIDAAMNHSLMGTESGLLGYWKFDEASGAVAVDSTGHGHNGALQNAPLRIASDAPIFP